MKIRLASGFGCLFLCAQLGLVDSSYAQEAQQYPQTDPAPVADAAAAPAAVDAAPAADAAAPVADATAPADAAATADAATDAAPVAAAPDAPATDSPKASSGIKNRLVEEVVVTAQKREQNLQKVPSSVQAFSGATLDAKGVADVKDLQLVTPGLTYDSMASYSIIFIRGVGGDAFQAGIDSSVATYIDGLYLPFTFSSAQALGDVKDIEVLKGPQGTLYGRNAIAGAITVKLKEPTPDYGGSILAQYGDYNDTKTKLSVHGAVPFTNDTLSLSGSFLYENHDAYDIYAIDPSQKYHPYRNIGYRGAAKWDPIDHLDIQFSYYDLKSQDADSVVTVLTKAAPLFKPVLTPIDIPHESGNQTNVGVFGHTHIANATITSSLVDWFDQKLILGHSSAHSDIFFDYDSAPEPVLDISALPNTEKSDSAEMIFTSNPVTSPDWLEWIGGLYYEDTTKTGRYPVKIEPEALALGVLGSAQFGGQSPLCQIVLSLGVNCTANPNNGGQPIVELPLTSGIFNQAKSVYGQLTAHFTEDASIVLGGRASTEKGRLNYSTVDARLILPNGSTTPTNTIISYRKQEHVWNSFTPNAGLNYQLTRDILLYYKYSEAFKSGNFNGLNINNPPQRVEPELASGNEIGFKSELFDDRSVKLNGAVFTTTITNAQEQTLSLTSGGVTSLQNAASYTVSGAETEVTWFATEQLVFDTSVVFLHGRYNDFHGRGFTADTGLDNEDLNFTGNKTVRTPTITATASVNYTFPLIFGFQGEAAADGYYNSGFYYDPLNTLPQPHYFIANARFGIYDPRTHVRLTGFGKNLNDGVYYQQRYRQDFGDTAIYGAPRTYGVTLTWDFGA